MNKFVCKHYLGEKMCHEAYEGYEEDGCVECDGQDKKCTYYGERFMRKVFIEIEIDCNGSSCGNCKKIRRVHDREIHGNSPVFYCDLFGHKLGTNPEGHFMRSLDCLSAEEK